MLLKRKRLVIATVAVVAAVALLVYIGVTQFGTYYFTVSEFVAEGDSIHGKQARVSGTVVAESVDWDVDNVTLRFILSEGGATLPVVYSGVVPDAFREDGDLVVEGKSDAGGVFNATKLVTKCPSKYGPAD